MCFCFLQHQTMTARGRRITNGGTSDASKPHQGLSPSRMPKPIGHVRRESREKPRESLEKGETDPRGSRRSWVWPQNSGDPVSRVGAGSRPEAPARRGPRSTSRRRTAPHTGEHLGTETWKYHSETWGRGICINHGQVLEQLFIAFNRLGVRSHFLEIFKRFLEIEKESMN